MKYTHQITSNSIPRYYSSISISALITQTENKLLLQLSRHFYIYYYSKQHSNYSASILCITTLLKYPAILLFISQFRKKIKMQKFKKEQYLFTRNHLKYSTSYILEKTVRKYFLLFKIFSILRRKLFTFFQRKIFEDTEFQIKYYNSQMIFRLLWKVFYLFYVKLSIKLHHATRKKILLGRFQFLCLTRKYIRDFVMLESYLIPEKCVIPEFSFFTYTLIKLKYSK